MTEPKVTGAGKSWVLAGPAEPKGWVELLADGGPHSPAGLARAAGCGGEPVAVPPWFAQLAKWGSRLLDELPEGTHVRGAIHHKLVTCLRRANEDPEFQKQVRTVVALGDGEAGLRWMLQQVYEEQT